MRDKLRNKTFIGIVEDNQDEKRLGRVRVRVINVFDEGIETDCLPWASPWKDLNGNGFNVPEVGKIVSVVFDDGNAYKPEYIFAEHYNANLESKLGSLSDGAYKSMKAVIFDHKTQLYSNDDEGLKIDYKFNNINITDSSVSINLKDNESMLNLGDATAGQQALLGNHWMDWFDKFVDQLLGSGGGPFIGNLQAPVIPHPGLIGVCQEYKALRDEKFLSQHVNLVDNNKVNSVRSEERYSEGILGDAWTASNMDNNLSSSESVDYSPSDNDKTDYDPDYVAPLTDGTPDSIIPENKNPLNSSNSQQVVEKLIKFLKSKNYKVYDEQNVINIVGMRNKPGGKVTNRFDDIMYVFYKNTTGKWMIMEYAVTTVPGYKPRSSSLPHNVAILKLGQYVEQYKIGYHQNKPDHKCLKFANSVVHRNDISGKYNYNARTQTGSFGINIHRSNKSGSGVNVNNWSEGCQVFKIASQFNQFMALCSRQSKKKSTFTYTLCSFVEFQAFN